MGWFTDFTELAGDWGRAGLGRVGDLKDGVLDTGFRGFNHARGTLFGMGGYNYMRKSLKTFYVRELLNDNQMKKDLKTLGRCSRHLGRYGEKRLASLVKRWGSNPTRLNVRVVALIIKFKKDLDSFLKAYVRILNLIAKNLAMAEKQQWMDSAYLEKKMNELKVVLKSQKEGEEVYIPRQVLDEAWYEFAKLEDRKKHILKSAQKEQEKLKMGKGIWMGPFGALVKYTGGYTLIHKIRSFAQKYYRDYLKDMGENWEEIEKQLADKKIKPDFLVRLEKHFKNDYRMDKLLKKLTHDIRVILSLVIADYKVAVEHISMFLGTFRYLEVVKDSGLTTTIQNLKKQHDLIEEQLEAREGFNTAKLKEQVQVVGYDLGKIFDDIEKISEVVKAKIIEDPEEIVNKFARKPT